MGTSQIAKLVFYIWLIVNAKMRVNRPTNLKEEVHGRSLHTDWHLEIF